MKPRWWILLLVLSLSIAVFIPAQKLVQTARQDRLQRQVRALQAEAAALVKEGKYAEAADTLEQLQVLFMNAGRYKEALDASLGIEEVSLKATDRKSPWNYVRIAEAYLGLGDKEKYVDWMEKAVYERSFSKLDYFKDARLAALESNPRYKKLVEACANEIGVGRRAKDFQVDLLDGSSFGLSAQLVLLC